MTRLCADWIKEYMKYSEHSEAPDIFHFWTAVSVIAGALRRRVWIDQGYFQWTPNFYIVFVAPPGIVSKSTTASIGMKLLKEVEEVRFGPDVVTWQSLVTSLAESTVEVDMPDGNYHPMSCLTISSSEFGNFLNPQDREMVDVLVSLWDGQVSTFEKRTKMSGNDTIVNPWINILACTTPAWIAGNFPEYMIGGGFTSRTVFVYGDKKRKLVAYPKKELPSDFTRRREKLVHDLRDIAENFKGEMTLSDEAILWGEKWYEKHYSSIPKHLQDDRFGGYIARKQTHLHKLAIVLCASEGESLVVQKHHLEVAEAILTQNEADMAKVFGNITSETAAQANRVATIVERVGQIEQSECFKMLFQSMSYDDFKAAVNGAVQAGFIRITQVGGKFILEPIRMG